jgi:phosphate-selective porin OprO and OprP
MMNGVFAGLLTLLPIGFPSPPAPPSPPPVTLQAPAAEVQFRWRDHPQIRTGPLRIDFVTKFQWDARDPGDEPSDFDTFQIHRARIGVEGELFNRVQFAIEGELTEREVDNPNPDTRDKSAWKDVYVDGNISDALQVRAGKFKIPFGLEQLTGISNLDFVYRSLSASYLAPARDIGVALHGRFFDRGLNYWAGWFRHDGDNARSSQIDGADGTFAARVTGMPFRSIPGLEKTELGGAFTVSALENVSATPNGLRGRTVMSHFVFYEPVFVNGHRRRYEVDADWYAGPFGARAEYTHVLDSREGQGLADQDLADARGRGWYVSGAWVMTGEEKDRPVRPARRFGAVEAAARYERLWFDSAGGEGPPLRNPRADNMLPTGQHVLSLGLNWYITRWVKLQFDTIREKPQDPERTPVAAGEAFWSSVFRFQVGI